MDVDDWHDPLLITDVSFHHHQQQQHQQLSINSHHYYPFPTLTNTVMEDPNSCIPIKIEDGFLEGSNAENFKDPVSESVINGREMFGFSLTSPDLVICTGSPDIPRQTYGDSPEFLKGCSISLENGIKGSEETPAASKCSTSNGCMPTHFELPSPPVVEDNNSSDLSAPIVSVNCNIEADELQEKELQDAKRQVEELKRENEQKSRECAEAVKSLKELQNELLRKSMHVGSLAFAIEGQVKEKSRWFSSLRDLTRKLKILKMDQITISEEALSFNQFQADFANMSSTIQSKCIKVIHASFIG